MSVRVCVCVWDGRAREFVLCAALCVCARTCVCVNDNNEVALHVVMRAMVCVVCVAAWVWVECGVSEFLTLHVARREWE